MEPVHITPALLAQYNGGQIFIRGVLQNSLYRGEIKETTINDDEDMIAVKLSWIGEMKNSSETGGSWIKSDLLTWEIDLLYFLLSIGEGRLYFRYGESIFTLYPRNDPKNIDPSMVAGLLLQEA